MSIFLDDRSVGAVEEAVQLELEGRMSPSSTAGRQAFSGDFLTLMVEHVALPILVSVSGSTLSEVLKGRLLSRIGKKETKALIGGLKHAPVDLDRNMTQDCLEALRAELAPLGFSDSDIHALYKAAQRRLAAEKSSSSGR